MNKGTAHILSIAAVFFGVSVILAVLAGVAGYRVSGSTAVIADEYRAARAGEEHIIALRALARSTENDWHALDRAMVRRSTIVAYIEDIERIADEAGLSSRVQSVTSAVDDGPLVVRLEVRGAFQDVMQMVYRLETLPYIAYVRALNLESVREGGWAAYVEVEAPAYHNDQP